MIMNERSRVQLTAASRCYMPGNRLAFSWTRGPGLLDKQCFPDLTERSMIFRFLLSVLRRILSHKGRCKVKAGSSCWTAGAVCCICTQLLIPKLLCLTCTLPPVCLVFFLNVCVRVCGAMHCPHFWPISTHTTLKPHFPQPWSRILMVCC